MLRVLLEDIKQNFREVKRLFGRFSHDRSGKEINWSGFRLCLGLLKESAGMFGPLMSTIVGFSRCIEIFERTAQSRVDYEILRTELDTLFHDLYNFWSQPTPPTITPVLDIIAKAIIRETEFIIQKDERSPMERVAESMEHENELLECYRRIHMLLQRVTLNVNLDTWRIVDKIAADTRLKNLSPSQAAWYNSEKSNVPLRGGCTPRTRIGVLKTLQDWAGNTQAQNVFWLNGMAGTGKTTIAYSLCEYLEATGKLAASFFCSRQVPECKTIGLVIPTIAYQLAILSYPFKCALSRAIEQDPKAHTLKLEEQFRKLIAHPMEQVEQTMPDDLVVVIDALDECDSKGGVAQMLRTLLSQAPSLQIKFFITSRPEPKIRNLMMSPEGESSRLKLHLHELDQPVVKEDIRTYLQDKLQPIDISPEDLELLARRSGVLFIYAATAVRYMSDEDFAWGTTRLKTVLNASGSSSSSNYKEIDALYSALLNEAFRIHSREQNEINAIRHVLHTVICAQEPLTCDTVAGLLGVDVVSTVQPALQPLFSVLNLSEKNGLVTTLHESFPDYLFSATRSGLFYCDKKSHHTRLAQQCLALIIHTKPAFNICGLDSTYMLDVEVPNLDERVDKTITKELFYACRYWGDHFSFIDPSTSIFDALNEFLSTRLLMWMEILNLKKCLRIGAGSLARVQGQAQTAGCPDKLQRLLQDAWKFAISVASSRVVESTPHIYVSALAFWPRGRPVWQCYSRQVEGLVEMTGTALQRRESAPLAICEGNSPVYCISCSPDGSRIVFGSCYNAIRICDLHTGQIIGEPLQGHTKHVNSVAYSPDGSRIVSGSEDTTIRIWDARTDQIVGEPLRGHSNYVNSVAYSPDGSRIVSGSQDKTIRIWDAQTGQTIGGSLRGHTGYVNSVVYSPDGSRIVSGSEDKTICIWDAHTGQAIGEPLCGHTSYVWSVAYSPNGSRIISGSWDNTLRIWDAYTGQTIGEPLQVHTGQVNSVAYSPNGLRIVSGSYDNTVCIWDACTGNMIGKPLESHTNYVWSVTYSPDGSRIISGSWDKTIHIWDAHAGELSGEILQGHTDMVKSVAYSPNGLRIVSGSYDTTICIWDVFTGQMVGESLQGHASAVNSVAYSPDGLHIASGAEDRVVLIWDTQTSRMMGQPLQGHRGHVNSVVYSPDATRIASGSSDNTIRIWDARTGLMIGEPLRGHTSHVNSVVYSPDGLRIVSGSNDKSICIWDAYASRMIGQLLQGHTGDINSVAYSLDGTRIISGSTDKTIRVWDTLTGQMLGEPLQGHTSTVSSVAYSPDGLCIVSGSKDKTIRFWDSQTGRIIGEPLEGHAGYVNSVAYSPDGLHLVSGSEDKTINIWDAQICRIDSKQQSSWTGLPHYTYSQYEHRLVTLPHSSRPSLAEANSSGVSQHIISKLNDDGWLVTKQAELLMWIPREMRLGLLYHPITLIICAAGWLRLNFDKARIGKSWSSIIP